MEKAPASSILNKIMASFFLVILVTGLGLNWISQKILSGILVKEGLQESVVIGISRTQLVSSSIFCLAAIIAALFIAYHLSRGITNPVTELRNAVIDIGSGNLNRKAAVDTDDELGQLALFFNKMAAELKKTHEELKDYSKNLEKQVEERTEELRLKIAEVKKINTELDDFTYIVSHDLKEPLRSIDAFTKFVVKDYNDKLDDEGKRYLERIMANASRIQELIEDLLELSRIERKKNPFEETDINAVIEEVRLRFEYIIKARGVVINVLNELPKVFCDRVRITEVFANLISNAIKFTDSRVPHIEIGCSLSGDYFEFYVKDNGPGIEEKYFGRIFEIFQRLERKERYDGTGAGLTIVKKIIEMHDGRVWVESRLGEGSTFYFSLPRAKKGG